jgi:hypothetical protein
LARSFSQEGWETLVKMMRNAGLPGNVRIKAYEAVLNRGIGLPAVAIDVTAQRVLAKKLCDARSRTCGRSSSTSRSRRSTSRRRQCPPARAPKHRAYSRRRR